MAKLSHCSLRADVKPFCLFQVGCVWEPSVAAQNFGPSLERGVDRSSESGFVLVGRARVARSSEQLHLVLDLRAAFLGSSELFVARAVWVFLRSIENFLGVLYQRTAAS
ncbi:unnamed protein product [Camellia sinensis]